MKHLKVALLALLFIAGFSNINAQDENNPWAVGIGINAVDFYPTNAGYGGWFHEYFNSGDHYNTSVKLTASRYLAKGFSFEVAGSLNKISKVGDDSVSDLDYFGLDGAIKYDLNKIIGDTSWFNPYATVGGGLTWLDNSESGTVNGGLGMNFWFNDHLGLNIESKYKHAFESDVSNHISDNMYHHFQHSLGLVYKFGGKDTDGDGIYDKKDACPEVFGLAEHNGCPDTDNDGVIDSEDDCPNTAGLATLNGCPDADEDGIADKDDACPNAKGTKANKGCPDTDGDGLVDKDDSCPKVAGPAANKGCPWPDTDGDGILDKDDDCVNLAGPASSKGCPEITEVEVAKLGELFKTAYFKTGDDEFKKETPAKLDEAAEIMIKYPTANFSISGHSDSTGSKAHNQDLSERRAKAVKSYLVSKGVSSSNLTSKGYGEDMPIVSNNTRAGRAQNRRVEVKLVD